MAKALPINQIIHGDCLEVMADWPDKFADLVLTDPPYNVGLGDNHYSQRQSGYDVHKDNLGHGDYEYFIGLVMKECFRLSRSIILTPGNANQSIYPAPLWTMAWIKRNGCTRTPLTRGQNMNHCCWEPILVYGKMDKPPKHDIFLANISQQVSAGGHPCPKPLSLFMGLTQTTNETSLILDPFCGSGTTCVAAKKLGRRFIGIDISAEYCEIARMRLKEVETGVTVAEQKQGQGALFDG